MVDGGIGCYLSVVGYISVGKLAADDIRVLGKSGESRGYDFNVV